MHCVSACDSHFDMSLYACISSWPVNKQLAASLVLSPSDSGVNYAWQVRSLMESLGPAMHGTPKTKLIGVTIKQQSLHY